MSWCTKRPEIAAKWHPTNNLGIDPEDVPSSSTIEFWWLDRCGHTFRSRISYMMQGQTCPICDCSELLSGVNDLTITHPEWVAEWDYVRNGSDRPDRVTWRSKKWFWWRCSKCGYEYRTSPWNRSFAKIGWREGKPCGCQQCEARKKTSSMKLDDILDAVTEAYNEYDEKKNPWKMPDYKSSKRVYWTNAGYPDTYETVYDHIIRKLS